MSSIISARASETRSSSLSSSPSSTSSSVCVDPGLRLEYVELLAKSGFSFLQGASQPEEMVTRAIELGYRGLALCDVSGLYGIVRGFKAAERPSAFDAEALSTASKADERGSFQYIVGSELTPYDASPLALLPMNKDGYARLSHIITAAKRPSPKGYIALSFRKILEENEDLIALPLPPWNDDDLRRLQEAFQDRLYLPVHRDLTWSSVALYRQALRIERDLKILPFATQRPLFHVPERKPLHDVLTCILHGKTLNDANVILAPNSERALKPLAEIGRLWGDRPDMLARTREIASRISFSLSELRYRYPQASLRPGQTPADRLREAVNEGLAMRFPSGVDEVFAKQIERELALIRELEYEDYFLTVADICAFARERGILHQGRGSAANSAVCFALHVTSVNPVALNLLFERFISRERGEPPDIDVDFEHERREEVIQYIYEKYGAQRAAMVCVTVCYRSRMAIREVAKVLGFSSEEISVLVKKMGREGLKRLLENEAPSDLARFKWLLRLAGELQGFPRHLGIHSGGFVISHDPIVDVAPVEKAAMDGRYVIQWNKDDVNTLGLMKLDILSLGMLTALRKTFDSLRDTKGLSLSLATIPQDDTATYDSACKADTVGVFQIESRAQMSLLPRLKPRRYYDLVVQVAIVRPGPIQGGMVHPFLRRREGREKIVYPHTSLEPILGKTLGVPLFQEQVMQIAVAAAGFTPGEADELRRIMTSHWNKTNIMDGLRLRLIGGMLANGIAPEFAEQIYRTIQGFSSYGFPESHSASFALLSYASLYLKCHHPDAFVCALLNSQPMGFYAPRSLVADAQRHGVSFLPLSVQSSTWDYLLEEPGFSTKSGEDSAQSASKSPLENSRKFAVRAGFRSIHGLRQIHVDKLVHERQAGGEFRSLENFVQRAQIPRNALLRLAAAGALNDFGLPVRETIWKLHGFDLDNRSLLFGTSGSDASELPSETEWESMSREYKSSGFSLWAHPLSILRPELRKLRPGFSTSSDLAKKRHQTRVRMAGLLAMMQKPPTAKGMCFLSLEDESGFFNAVLTPDIYERVRLTIMSHALLDIQGLLENRSGVLNVKVESLKPLRLTEQRTLEDGQRFLSASWNGPSAPDPRGR